VRVISNEETRCDPWATTIAGSDAIVRAPYGAHPFYSRGFYVQDNAHLREYVEAASAAAQEGKTEALVHYLAHYCREPATLSDYLERIGIKRLLSLYEY
jgi:glutaconate CoA-transferase subunit A